MGIKKFTGTFIEPLSNVSETAYKKVVAAFIDGNQFLYFVLGLISKKCIKKDDTLFQYDKDETSFWKEIEECIKIVIGKELLEPLSRFIKLCHITFCLDGLCNSGKLVQQFIRRKNSSYFTDASGKILLADTLILPRSKLVRMFGEAVKDIFVATFKERNVSLVFSLDDIPGEGEHKMLDFYRSSVFHHEKQHSIVWSDDSDVSVSMLLSQCENLYCKGSTVKFVDDVQVKEDKYFLISELRAMLCSDQVDRMNCQLLINFFGNDFLPEMLNTIELRDTYNVLKKATEGIQLITGDNQFNPVSFLAFLNKFDDFTFYFTFMGRVFPQRVVTSGTFQGTFQGTVTLPQFSEVFQTMPPTDKASKLNFKRFYYSNVMRLENNIEKETFTDEEIYNFEMEMSFSYLKTYIWYFYYINGYYLEMPDTFYKFNFPPLFNSLKKLFLKPTNEMKELLSLVPKRRTPEYYLTLVSYDSPLPQMAGVLQMKDLMLHSNDTRMIQARKEVEHLYPVNPEKSLFVKTRYSKRIYSDEPVAPGKKRKFTVSNSGTKVYPKFNPLLVIQRVAELLEITPVKGIQPLVIGTVERVEFVEHKDVSFAVCGTVELY